MSSHVFSNMNDALPALMGLVLNAPERDSRNGKVREQLMVQTTLMYPGNGYLTDPERKASLPAQIAETMWLLAGRNDVEWLSHYLPRAAEFSDDGKTWRGGYGPRIRKWVATDAGDGWAMDQLHHVVQLLTEDPNTRRAVINIYNPTVDSAPGKDIPCNNWVHFIARDGVLNAHVAIRSNDLMWGFSGINHFEWTQLMNIVAGLTGLAAGTITFSTSSLHLYEPYWPKAMRIARGHTPGAVKMKAAPRFSPKERSIAYLDAQVKLFFKLEELIRTGQAHHLTAAKMDEPLFRSWLQVLYTWHNPISPLPQYLRGTDLEAALDHSPRYKHPAPDAAGTPRFKGFVQQLHAEKHAAYGDSWMRRGEQMGIMANIARKVDRLGVAGGGDTSADTAIDLLAYLVKYDLWLQNAAHGGVALTGPLHLPAFNARLHSVADSSTQGLNRGSSTDNLVVECKREFDNLETLVREGHRLVTRRESVGAMLLNAYPLAMRLWMAEQNETRSWNPEKVDAGA